MKRKSAWEKIKDKVYTILEEPALKEYLDTEKLQKLLEEALPSFNAKVKAFAEKVRGM